MMNGCYLNKTGQVRIVFLLPEYIDLGHFGLNDMELENTRLPSIREFDLLSSMVLTLSAPFNNLYSLGKLIER